MHSRRLRCRSGPASETQREGRELSDLEAYRKSPEYREDAVGDDDGAVVREDLDDGSDQSGADALLEGRHGAGQIPRALATGVDLGLDERSARTIALEVGLQNGGMASGLAGAMGKLGTMGLAAAIFSPWMNVSGSILANYWKRRPVGDAPDPGVPRPGEATRKAR